VVLALLSCGKRHEGDKTSRRADAGDRRPPTASFELKVETNENGVQLLVFRFPDRVAVIPRINSISIGKVGMRDVFCTLDIVNRSERPITGYWPIGTVPQNYRSEGCAESRLSPGDYEVALFTQRGEARRRIHVGGNGDIKIAPWEGEKVLPWDDVR
jgi:hypothetical protein